MKKTLKIFLWIILSLIIFFAVYKLKDIILKKVYTTKYLEYVEKYSSEYKVDKYLIFAIIKAESNFKENAVSNKKAKGLMQLIDTTAEEVAESIGLELNENDILNPEININLGTKYISTLISRYSSLELALCSYNAGSGNVDNWLENGMLEENNVNIQDIPYNETKKYVKKILTDYEIYKKLYK